MNLPSGLWSSITIRKCVLLLGIDWSNQTTQVRLMSLTLSVVMTRSCFIDWSSLALQISLMWQIHLMFELKSVHNKTTIFKHTCFFNKPDENEEHS